MFNYACGYVGEKLTTLIFGNVVVESQLLAAQVRIYGKDMRSYYMRPNPYVDISVPLDTLREKIDFGQAEAMAERTFDSVKAQLDEAYPGGSKQAQYELAAWLKGAEN